MNTSYVYFIQAGRGAVKIGVSDSPKKRLTGMQTGNSKPLKIIALLPFADRPTAQRMERHLHNTYSNFRLNGEWFHRNLLKKIRVRGFGRLFKGSPGEPIPKFSNDESN